jgi:hypothetical protein
MSPFLLLFVLACGGEPAADSGGAGDGGAAAGPGTLSLSFGIDLDYRDVMEEPAVGPFWGTVYRAEDVSGVGPADGAEGLADVYVEVVDLSGEGGASEALFETGPLEPGEVVILGFLDSDGNAEAGAPDPDDRDPVTLPADNGFTVVGDTSTAAQVWLGFLNP